MEPKYSDKAQTKAYDAITYPYDGPITVFVLIGRAMDYVTANPTHKRETSNALYNALSNLGLNVDSPYVAPPFEC